MTTTRGVNDIMSVALSRHLRDGDMGFIGVGSSGRSHELVTSIPISAAHIARQRGIDVDLQIGPLISPSLTEPPATWSDNEIYGWRASALITSDANMDAFLRGLVTVGFVSGAQIDQWGNVNVNRLRTSTGWKRLGGALALPEHCAFAKRAVLIADLAPHTFVSDVDYVSGFGHQRNGLTRAALSLPGGGPSLVVTDKALFDFKNGRMRLCALYPGSTVGDVLDSMSFEPDQMEGLSELQPPTAVELQALAELTLPALPWHHADR